MINISRSLADLCGQAYVEQVCRAGAATGFGSYRDLLRTATEPVDFWPDTFIARCQNLQARCGQPLLTPWTASSPGAGTRAFDQALHKEAAPIGGLGCYRIGEDGRIYAATKSEHYHAPLGHNFPGYHLLDRARTIGISNITHNNTRGHITRCCERRIVQAAHGLATDAHDALEQVLRTDDGATLNRVINLQTGSLACEAALKMMLARFYRLHPHSPAPPYAGRTPVIIVLADHAGGPTANYHGTTLFAQMQRGMWPELYAGLERAGMLRVVPCRINDSEHFARIIAEYDHGTNKIAGFFHELVLMNYGAIRLTDTFVEQTQNICHKHDIPVCVDEIQSCLWAPELFLFRSYPCRPDFVTLGKGFPGGQYAAAKILTTARMDTLDQFGALVTNGQEELAALAYLITMEFAAANAAESRRLAVRWRQRLTAIANRHPNLLNGLEGDGLLTALVFASPDRAVDFCRILASDFGLEASAQTYKASCPPAALLKPPLIMSDSEADFFARCINAALDRMPGPA